MSPASAMLLQAATRLNQDSWLVLGGEADLVSGLATDRPAATMAWQPVDVREANALPAGHPTVQICPVESGTECVDVVVLPVSPDRGLARRWLLVASERLAPHGTLLIAGANAEGIRSVIADATAMFGAPEFERYGQRQRIAGFRSASAPPVANPDWAAQPGVAPGTWSPFAIDTGRETLPLVSRAGVFAGANLDAGTRLLLDSLSATVEGAVLDLGCGAGIIGLVAASRGAASVVLSDSSLLAVATAEENVRRLAFPQCEVVAGDVYTGVSHRRFDLILSNPPFHRGKTIDFTVADRLIDEAPVHLNDGGHLLVVANAFLAYGKRMTRVFGRVETLAATRQFHVLAASKPR
jgi:16S rRNA (guanine1207-N2)-methyltransferase